MVGSEQILLAYVRLIRRVTGAELVSLYLPAPAGSFPRPALLHEGELPLLPELADEEAAERFCAEQSGSPLEPVPSTETRGWLVRFPLFDALLAPRQEDGGELAPTRRRTDRGDSAVCEREDPAWLGLRLPAGRELEPVLREVLIALDRIASGRAEPHETWHWLLPVGSAVAWHNRRVASLMQEPVSQLPGRAALQSILLVALERASQRKTKTSLLLINPDGFDFVNGRFGREAGDEVVREIAERLTGSLRRNDFICRYGGAVFGVVLSEAGADEARAVAAKICQALNRGGYLGGSLRLSFSLGVAAYGPEPAEGAEEASLTLIRRADRALNSSKQAGGNRTAVWSSESEFEEVGQFDRLSGIFTANQAKDYRNMLLLWDTVRAVVGCDDIERMVEQVLDRLLAAFHPDLVGVYEQRENGGYRLLRSVGPRGGDGETVGSFDEERSGVLDEALQQGRAIERRLLDPASQQARLGCAVPMLTGDRRIGVLYLEGRPEAIELDAADRILLSALAGQLAVVLDRARLMEQEHRRLEQESRSLRQELNELRQVLHDAKLIYRSPQMEAVLETARRVAPTDATVLIIGESGTGKELVARTVHALSERRERPLVVVDCSAIATSLIDSELFGHERGAYTGAERRSAGRLAEAAGGTVLLDEIGELPLDVQGKLLRFVQEKQFTPVGGTRPQSVDVRVIAATNRDLPVEIAAGRFREDLFFRLKVVQVSVPPLRERPDDVIMLAQHFIDRSAVQYQKGPRRLSPLAERRLLAHDWPGNVRELQNRALQAVILSEKVEIGAAEFGLNHLESEAGAAPDVTRESGEDSQPTDPWDQLARILRGHLEIAVGQRPVRSIPIAKWVDHDLILTAHRVFQGVSARAATALGLPETTYRRRLQKALLTSEFALPPRPPGWDEVLQRLESLLAGTTAQGEDLPARLRGLLLDQVRELVPADAKLAAGFMGVTETTYRRWVQRQKIA